MDELTNSTASANCDPPFQESTILEASNLTTPYDDDPNTSKSCLDVITVGDLKKIFNDFKLDFSLAPT